MTSLSDSGLSPLLREVIEQIVYDFECDFATGNAKPLTEYLNRTGADDIDLRIADHQQLNNAALVELVKVDLELSWQAGHRKSLKDYTAQYPSLGTTAEVPADLVYEAWRVARRHDETVRLEIFCDNFPAQKEAILQLEAEQAVSSQPQATTVGPPQGIYPGQTIGDFELIRLLGTGAFAHVFLANQLSLDREVALKISENRGREAKTMASLEHDHIVQVFSESVDAKTNLRLLCMQYVPGTNLGKVISHLRHECDEQTATHNALPSAAGLQFVNAIDEFSTGTVPFHTSALRDRDLLKDCDAIEVACLLGARLAEALHYAHQQGVLHRDIKPDNILLSPFGRPLLADFNLSTDRLATDGITDEMFGGSLDYMAPEHIAAFNPQDTTSHEAVDCRSDIYALGVVLFEILAQRRPFERPNWTGNVITNLLRLREQRMSRIPRLRSVVADASISIDSIIAKCLSPSPDDRFQTADKLQQALEDAGQLQAIEQAVPKSPQWMQALGRKPFWPVLFAILIPNLIGSAINIAYNYLFIVPRLTSRQATVFQSLTAPFNLTVYPICLVILFWYAKPFLWPSAEQIPPPESQDPIRQRLVRFPMFAVWVGCLGWIPGGIIFPAVIHSQDAIRLPQVAHFVTDFAISGLIALTYTFFALQAIVLGTLYLPRLAGTRQPAETAKIELKNTDRNLRIAQIMSGIVPLAGALLLVVIGPLTFSRRRRMMFRFLLFGLIALGMVGFSLAVKFGNRLQRTINAIRGRV